MQIASFHLVLNKFGNSVPKRFVTPAEFAIWRHLHGGNVGGSVIAPKTFTLHDMPKTVRIGTKPVLAKNGRQRIDKDGNALVENITRTITQAEELALLRRRYLDATIQKLWPGMKPSDLPTSFSDVGVNDAGEEKTVESAAAIEVINPDGIEVIHPQVYAPKVADPSDSVSVPREIVDAPYPDGPAVETRSGAPELVIASGRTADDGGRPA